MVTHRKESAKKKTQSICTASKTRRNACPKKTEKKILRGRNESLNKEKISMKVTELMGCISRILEIELDFYAPLSKISAFIFTNLTGFSNSTVKVAYSCCTPHETASQTTTLPTQTVGVIQ